MSFSPRDPSQDDLIWCAQILEDGFESRPDLQRELPRLWRRLLREEAMSMVIIVDDRTAERVAFGAACVLSDYALEIVRHAGRPNFAVRLMEQELRGEPWILRPVDVRRVNHPRHRVNLSVIHYSELIPGRSFDEQRVIREKAVSELLLRQRGYALKEFVFEFYGEDDLAFTKQMGLQLRSDYRDYYETGKHPVPPKEKRPFLVGLTLDEIAQSWGSPVGLLFAYTPPQLFFTDMQRRVLLRACRTPTPGDAEIADDLTIERGTLRDHWRRIFARVAEVQADGVLPASLPDFAEPSRQLRSALLSHLQQHPEELRPIDKKHFVPRPERK